MNFFGTCFSHRLPNRNEGRYRAREGDAGSRLSGSVRAAPAPPTWHDAACRQLLHEVGSADQSGDIGLNGSAKASNHRRTKPYRR